MTDNITNAIIPLTACRPHPANYNRHDTAQITDLRASLRAFGQVRSIVVQVDPDRIQSEPLAHPQPAAAPSVDPLASVAYLIVAGHGLIEAARLENLPTLRADIIPATWSPVKVLAYLAADNELARRGDPDQAQLAALVAQVNAEADANLAALAAGSAERLAEMLAAELQDVDTGGGASLNPNSPSLIRLVVDMADVQLVESAIAATGESNRSAAITELCRSYLRAKGQLDRIPEGAVAS